MAVERLRILHAIHDFLPRHRAGSEIYAFALASVLAARHHVHVLCADYDPLREHGHVAWRLHAGLPVVEVVNNWVCTSFEETYRSPVIGDRLGHVWQAVQPLIKARQLKAIFIEASYPNTQPEKQLFGHLTPALLMQEMEALGHLAGPAVLRGMPVVITHLKPSPGNEALIKKQLTEANKLQLKLVFPEQGRRLEF